MQTCNKFFIRNICRQDFINFFWSKKRNRLITYISSVLLLLIVLTITLTGIAISIPNWMCVCKCSYWGSYHHYTIGQEMFTYFDVAADRNYIEVDGVSYNLSACHVNDNYGYEATGHSRDGICAIHCLDNGRPIHKTPFENYDAIINNPWIDSNGNLRCTFVIPLRDGHGLDVQDMGAEDMQIPPANGGISVQKYSRLDWSEQNKNYSLDGTVYDIYSNLTDAQNYNNCIQQIILNGDGYGQTGQNDLKVGTYYVRENQNTHGTNYLLNTDIGIVNVASSKICATSFNNQQYTQDTPLNEPQPPIVQKSNLETENLGVTAGDVSDFAGAKYKFEYYEDYFTNINEAPSSCKRFWSIMTDKSGKTGISEKYKNNFIAEESSIDDKGNILFFKNQDGKITCPLGTYVISETLAPKGYLISTNTYIIQIRPDEQSRDKCSAICYEAESGKEISTSTDKITKENLIAANEQIIRGDFSFSKVDAQHKSMNQIPFLIKSTTTGEAHVIVSDNNGCIDTDSKNIPHTFNTNANDKFVDLENEIVLDASSLTPNCGIWFSQDHAGLLSQPDDEKCALTHDTYTITELVTEKNAKYQPFEKRSISVINQGYKKNMPDWVNTQAQITTKANCVSTNENWTYASKEEEIKDHIEYINFVPGHEYIIKSWIVDSKNKEIVPIKNGAGGENYLITNYNCNKSSGSIDVSALCDTTKYSGSKLVWFTEVKLSNNTIVCESQDLTNNEETITIKQPTISTNLHISGETRHELSRYSDMSLTDEVIYSGLKPNERYEIYGILYSKTTGQAYINEITNNNVKTKLNFVAKSDTGNIEIQYMFDGSLINNEETLVSFVDICIEDDILCKKHDINDLNESVHMPAINISTNLTCGEDGSKTFIAQNNMQINDTINYINLPLYKECNIFTWLVNKETGLPIHNYNTDASSAKDKMDNFVDYLGGRVIEKQNINPSSNLYQNNNTARQWIVEFDEPANKIKGNIYSDGSSFDFSDIAFNRNDLIINNSQDITISPIVFDFAAEDEQDIVALTVVVCDDTVVSHSTDINNLNETVSITRSDIATSLTDIDGNKEVSSNPQIMLKDVIKYDNCIQGGSYTIKGKIIKKNDCSVVAENSKDIIIDASSGNFENDFQLSSNGVLSEDLVAYETLYLNKDIAAEDCNIENSSQTVHIKSPIETITSTENSKESSKTNDEKARIIAIIAIITVISSILGYKALKKKLMKN